MSMAPRLAALLLSLCPAAGYAATIRHDVADSNYTNLSAQPAYAASGYISIDSDAIVGNTSSFSIGSGTLVAPNWVLTAAHVVTSGATVWPTGQITFGQGANRPGSLVGSYGVAQVVVHPGWNGSLDNGNDIALIQLTSNVAGITPAPLYNTAALGAETGKTAAIVGYAARTGTGLTGDTTTPNYARRAFTNVVDAFGGGSTLGSSANGVAANYGFSGTSPSVMLVDFDSPDNNVDGTADGDPSDLYNVMGSGDPTAFEGSGVPGDSGGGLFIDVAGTSYLAGVTSFVGAFGNSPFIRSAHGYYGDINGFIRVSQHLSFINGVIPEPTSLLLLTLGALSLAARRRAA